MTPEQEAHFRLLKTLEQHPEYSQRDIAEAVGMSLGRTNYVIHALMEKGFLKIGKFLKADNKLTKTAYILTPAGIRHRMELTQGYIQRKKAEYEALKVELENLRKETPEAFEEPDLNTRGKKALQARPSNRSSSVVVPAPASGPYLGPASRNSFSVSPTTKASSSRLPGD